LRILVLTHLFPNCKQKQHGVFIKERVQALAKHASIQVVAPVPWFPPLKLFKKWYFYSQIPKHEIIDGVAVFHPRFLLVPKIGRYLTGLFYFFCILNIILKRQRQFGFDILDVHWAYPDGFAGALFAELLHKPIMITVRGTDINLFPQDKILRKMIVYALRKSNRVTTVSKALAEKVKDLGISQHKIKVIPNGVDISKFRLMDKKAARKELSLAVEKTILLTVGYQVECKGFHYLVDAVEHLVKNDNSLDILLLIVGGANAQSGSYPEYLKNHIQKVKMNGHVRLIDNQPHQTLYKWYNAADLFCLASSREGWPNVLFESLACGTPVVATAVGGVPEVISSQNYGYLVANQDKIELAGAIGKALKKKWHTQSLVEYAKLNTWNNVAANLLSEYRAIINKQNHK